MQILAQLGLATPAPSEDPLDDAPRVDVMEQPAVRKVLDEAVHDLLMHLGFEEDVTLVNVRLALMAVAVLVGGLAHVVPEAPPQGVWALGVFVWLYAALAGLVQLLAWWEGDRVARVRGARVVLPQSGAPLVEVAKKRAFRQAQEDFELEEAGWWGVGRAVAGLCVQMAGVCWGAGNSDEDAQLTIASSPKSEEAAFPPLTVRVAMDRYEEEVRLTLEWVGDAPASRPGPTDKEVERAGAEGAPQTATVRRTYGAYFTKSGHFLLSKLADDVVLLLKHVGK